MASYPLEKHVPDLTPRMTLWLEVIVLRHQLLLNLEGVGRGERKRREGRAETGNQPNSSPSEPAKFPEQNYIARYPGPLHF